MATIAGPKIQVPSALSDPFVRDGAGKILAWRSDWASFFHSAQQTVFLLTRSGPTASRPTSVIDGRWIGMPYYDTTLGLPVFLHSVNPDVWHNGAGAVV